MKKYFCLLIGLLLSVFSNSQIINIPGDYNTIQEGINAAVDGDIVLVQPGTYVENINYNGKNITVGSLYLLTQDTAFISETIIDGNESGSVVKFGSGEDSSAALCGLTITNGYAWEGGGIHCKNSNPSLTNLTITGNFGSAGGGIYCSYSSPVVQNVTMSENEAGGLRGIGGGGIYCSNANPVLQNVTITNNYAYFGSGSSGFGGGIYCSNSNPTLEGIIIQYNTASNDGVGGIYSKDSNPSLQNVVISNNSNYGIYCINSSPCLTNVTITANIAYTGAGMYCIDSSPVFDSINRCNIYLNDAAYGNDLYSNTSMDVIVDTFTVLFPSEFYAEPLGNFTFDILHGIIEQVDEDLYVSPLGDNTNAGLTEEEPLKTIRYAFSKIRADSLNQNTIHLLEGTYSTSSNDEFFPVVIPDYISLSGVSESDVILDAENQSSAILIDLNSATHISSLFITGGLDINGGGIYCNNSTLMFQNVTIKGNSATPSLWGSGRGGGIYIVNSNPMFQNVTIKDNTATSSYWENGCGGGIYIVNSNPMFQNVTITSNSVVTSSNWKIGLGGGIFCVGSIPALQNITITNNSAENGGGIFCENTSPVLQNITIKNNSSDKGGGIYCKSSSPALQEVTITSNNSDMEGGGIYLESSSLFFNDSLPSNIYLNEANMGRDLYSISCSSVNVAVDTFTVLYPNHYYAYPLSAFSFDIFNGKLTQYDQDLYVSSSGSNENTGLTPEDPLMSITKAMKTICTPGGPHTIHLAPGSYSASLTGEQFPILCQDSVSICGIPDSITMLDGEGNDSVLHAQSVKGFTLTNFNICNGMASYGGGIYSLNSYFTIDNLIIHNNSATSGGGGMYFEGDCQLDTDNLNLSNNYASTGGGIYLENAIIDLENVVLKNNVGHNQGGGIFCNQSDPVFRNCLVDSNSSNNGGGVACNESNPLMQNVTISNNSAHNGGGIFCVSSNPDLQNVTIASNNSTINGGGIYLESSTLSFNDSLRSNISLNKAHWGKDLYSISSPTVNVVVDTFSVLYPNNYYAFPMSTFSFDILHGKLPQYDQDLYVSPSGSDENTGLTPEDPIKSITKAMKTICTPGGPHTVHLAPGTYSFTQTGEQYPIMCQDSVSIYGIPGSITTLDGESANRILHAESVRGFTLSNLKIYNGKASYGGGIYAQDADLILDNLVLHDNSAVAGGGGLFIKGICQLDTDSLKFNNNTAYLGGGIYLENAVTELEYIVLNNNIGNSMGGGIYCYQSDAIFKDLLLDSNISNGGGGFACVDCDPFLGNVTFQDNLAHSSGGGLWLDAASPFLFDVEIINNTSSDKGGGMYLQDTSEALLMNVEFRDNKAGDGGGLYCDRSQPVLIQCSFFQNESNNGAGLYLDQSDPVLSYLNVGSNIASMSGGGIYLNNHSRPYIMYSTINTNEARNGGGFFNTYKSNPYLSESYIINNSSFYGGGIYFMDSSTVTFDHDNRCNIFLNNANYEGADLYANGCEIIPVVVDTFTVLYPKDFYAYQTQDFTFDIWNYKSELGEFDIYVSPEGSDDNTGTSPDDPLLTISTALSRVMIDTVPPFIVHLASGIYSDSLTGENYPLYGRSNIWLQGESMDSTVLDGDSTQILKIIGRDDLQISDITLKNGWTAYNGGGIYCADAIISLERVGITGCNAKYGGGLFITGLSTATLKDIQIFNNVSAFGGGVYCGEESSISGNNLMIFENTSSQGAGLYCTGESIIGGNNIQIFNNSTRNLGQGGAVYCKDFNGKLYNLTINYNEASKGRGGGIYFHGSSPHIYNTVVSHNIASRGGAFYSYRSNILKISNVTISNNNANLGGALYSAGGSLQEPSVQELTNCIIWNNDHEQEIYLENSGLMVSYSDIEDGQDSIIIKNNSWVEWLDGNIDADPWFFQSGEHPFSISEGSPCIDAGTPDTTGQYLPFWDIIGNDRIVDGDGDGVAIVDMGAYEYAGGYVGNHELQVAGCRLQVRVFPNPSSGISDIKYQVPVGNWQLAIGKKIELSIYDINGQNIRTLVNKKQSHGKYKIRFDGSDLPAGIYLVRLQAGSLVETAKLVVIR